jgi:acyl-CoA dehydrogenase
MTAHVSDGARVARPDLVEKARHIGATIAGPAADDVDRQSRFPREALAALREARLLGIYIPEQYGGQGCSFADLSLICQALARHCAATGMVYAMHQGQIACVIRHLQASPFFERYLREAAAEERLLASATSEVGVGGDIRTSLCAVEHEAGKLRLVKNASVISYGEHCDDILITARRGPEAPESDQVLVLARKGAYTLERKSTWDTLGMRGTCSPGFRVVVDTSSDHVLPAPFADILPQTALPFSHVLWSSVWLGIAESAIDSARAFVRAQARKKPGVIPPGALRLAEAVSALQSMRAGVHEGVRMVEERLEDREGLGDMGFTLRMNNLKVATAQAVVQLAGQALLICGIEGYKSEGKFSVGRQLRDAHSAPLMIANDRILAVNSALLIMHRED